MSKYETIVVLDVLVNVTLVVWSFLYVPYIVVIVLTYATVVLCFLACSALSCGVCAQSY